MTITVTNNGPSPANVRMVDMLPVALVERFDRGQRRLHPWYTGQSVRPRWYAIRDDWCSAIRNSSQSVVPWIRRSCSINRPLRPYPSSTTTHGSRATPLMRTTATIVTRHFRVGNRLGGSELAKVRRRFANCRYINSFTSIRSPTRCHQCRRMSYILRFPAQGSGISVRRRSYENWPGNDAVNRVPYHSPAAMSCFAPWVTYHRLGSQPITVFVKVLIKSDVLGSITNNSAHLNLHDTPNPVPSNNSASVIIFP